MDKKHRIKSNDHGGEKTANFVKRSQKKMQNSPNVCGGVSVESRILSNSRWNGWRNSTTNKIGCVSNPKDHYIYFSKDLIIMNCKYKCDSMHWISKTVYFLWVIIIIIIYEGVW